MKTIRNPRFSERFCASLVLTCFNLFGWPFQRWILQNVLLKHPRKEIRSFSGKKHVVFSRKKSPRSSFKTNFWNLWMFPKIVVPPNGWFRWFGGTTIFGHILVGFQHCWTEDSHAFFKPMPWFSAQTLVWNIISHTLSPDNKWIGDSVTKLAVPTGCQQKMLENTGEAKKTTY